MSVVLRGTCVQKHCACNMCVCRRLSSFGLMLHVLCKLCLLAILFISSTLVAVAWLTGRLRAVHSLAMHHICTGFVCCTAIPS
jgi:hypothetical protein